MHLNNRQFLSSTNWFYLKVFQELTTLYCKLIYVHANVLFKYFISIWVIVLNIFILLPYLFILRLSKYHIYMIFRIVCNNLIAFILQISGKLIAIILIWSFYCSFHSVLCLCSYRADYIGAWILKQ